MSSDNRPEALPFRSLFLTFALALGFAGLVWFATASPSVEVDLFEQGHWLGPASDMLAGKVPYRDTLPVHGLLMDGGLDFIAFRIFGPSFRVSIGLHHLLAVLFQPAIFLVAAAATRKPWLAALAIPLNIGFAIGTVFDRPIVPLLSLAAFLWAIDDTRPTVAAATAGFLGGLGLLYAIEFGAFVLTAELVTLASMRLARRRETRLPVRSAAFFLGLAAVLVPFGAALAMGRALLPFLRTSFLDLPVHIGRVWGVRFPAPWTVLVSWLHGTPYPAVGFGSTGVPDIGLGIGKRLYLTLLVGLSGLVVASLALRRRGPRPFVFRILALATACLLFFRYVAARFHFEGGNALVGPLFLLLLCAIYELLLPRRPISLLATGAAAMAAALAMNAPARGFWLARSALDYGRRASTCSDCQELRIPRGGGVRVSRAAAQRLHALRAFSDGHVSGGGKILDLSNEPALYFFLERTNPTRFYQTPLMAPFQDEVLRDLQRTPPELVVLASRGWLDAPDGFPNSARVPRVWDYVRRSYPRRIWVANTLLALPATSLSGQSSPPEAETPSLTPVRWGRASRPRPEGSFRWTAPGSAP